MAFTHGSKAVFIIGDSGAVARNISAYLKNVDFDPTVDKAETTVFGLSSKTFITGLKDGKFTVQGVYDPVVDGYLNGIYGGFLSGRAFEYGPQGNVGASGTPKYTGLAHLTSYKVSTPLHDVGTFDATFEVTGDVTRTTY